MLTEVEDPTALTGRSRNYFSFAVKPTIEDNLFMIVQETSDARVPNKIIEQKGKVEIIFEVSLN